MQFIRDEVKPTPVTLAIGDGANDVPLLVGVVCDFRASDDSVALRGSCESWPRK